MVAGMTQDELLSENLGKRLHELRVSRHLTLSSLAKSCDCSIALLSKIEKGKARPSLNTLHRIATALDTNIGNLLPTARAQPATVVRKGDRPILSDNLLRGRDGVQLEALSIFAPGSSFQVNIHHVAVGGRSDGCITHPGEEFIYVLSGTIDLILGEETTRMEAGDSAFFASVIPHGYANPGDVPAAVLWLNSPPTF
ncbi:helix-turn-helix domain-containing protein [Azospirillum halopraeferens]|uniref:helix-turn-helix domain-containing protein n=1 Tax=Azospirillum halopraeferens TaxID=34010 RepID=UPI000420C558|nr:XRE family transcriptional regulator [Azospirillum halopraeferens]